MIINYLLLVFVASLIPFWQFAVAPVFGLTTINLVLIILLSFTIIEHSFSLLWVLLAGFMLDIFSDTAFGVFTLSLFVTYVVAHLLHERYRKAELFPLLVISSFGTLVYNLSLWLFNLLAGVIGVSSRVISISDIFSWQLLFEIIILTIVLMVIKIFVQNYGQKSLTHI